MNEDQFWRWVDQARTWVIDNFSLESETALAYAYAAVATWTVTGVFLQPTSGFRSLAKQADLFQRFLAGEPGISRPAKRSWHTEGRAFDVPSSADPETFAVFERMAALVPGLRNGCSFDDCGHFDLPSLAQPRPAF